MGGASRPPFWVPCSPPGFWGGWPVPKPPRGPGRAPVAVRGPGGPNPGSCRPKGGVAGALFSPALPGPGGRGTGTGGVKGGPPEGETLSGRGKCGGGGPIRRGAGNSMDRGTKGPLSPKNPPGVFVVFQSSPPPLGGGPRVGRGAGRGPGGPRGKSPRGSAGGPGAAASGFDLGFGLPAPPLKGAPFGF